MQFLQLKDNPGNKYVVLHACEKYMQLQCALFVKPEDLGDGILCTRQDQTIWIAAYFSHKFVAV